MYFYKNTNQILFKTFSAILFFLTIVIPNSLPILTFGFLILSSIVIFNSLELYKYYIKFLYFYLFGLVVTFVYLIVGVLNGSPEEAVVQTVLIYIVSPILWSLVTLGVLELYDNKQLFNIFNIYVYFAVFSVAIFYYMFLKYGQESVSFFSKGANVNIKDGYAGATMHVYGSLMFFISGYFASPSVIKNVYNRYFLFSLLLIVVFTSGRTALFLSVFIGLFCNIIHRFVFDFSNLVELISKIFIFSLFGIFLLVLFSFFTNIDLEFILKDHFNNISEFGGSARSDQLTALLSGINKNFGFGSGFGIGVDYVRNEDYPWRYELVWFATLFRVGLFGTVIYSSVFVYYFIIVIKEFSKIMINNKSFFMFGGFLSAFLSSNTNPYIESFTMQWMYILPILYLFKDLDSNFNTDSTIIQIKG